MEKEKLLNAKEAAAMLHTTLHQIYNLTSQKRIPHYKIGGRRLVFKPSELEDWVKKFKVEVIDQPL